MHQGPSRLNAVERGAAGVVVAALVSVLAVSSEWHRGPVEASHPSPPRPSHAQPCPGSATVRDLTAPVVVSHRGGSDRSPEASMEGFEASARAGFPVEMDLRPLADGTLVALHDVTVDRTMTAVTGRASTLSAADWSRGQVKPVQPGGPTGTPATWTQILSLVEGSAVLVPEIKPPGAPVVDSFLASVRGCTDALIVQSREWDVAVRLARAGLHVLLLTGRKGPPAAAVRAAGIEFVGVAKSADRVYISDLQGHGLHVWPYTVAPTEVQAELDLGADGVFTDDPWAVHAKPWSSGGNHIPSRPGERARPQLGVDRLSGPARASPSEGGERLCVANREEHPTASTVAALGRPCRGIRIW